MEHWYDGVCSWEYAVGVRKVDCGGVGCTELVLCKFSNNSDLIFRDDILLWILY